MLFGSLLLAAIVGNLLLFVPPIQTVSKCTLLQEQLRLGCPTNSSINSFESEDEPENFAPLNIPRCFEKKQEKKNKFGSNSNLRNTSNRPSKILQYRLNHCMIRCKDNEKAKQLRWNDKNQNEFRGSGFCLTSEEFNEELCFKVNNTNADKLQFSLDISMNSQPESNQFHGVITEINRENQFPDIEAKLSSRFQKLNCISAAPNDCQIQCSIEKNTMLPNMQQTRIVDAKSHFITFWTYLVLRVFMVIIIATEMSLLKAAILTMVNANGSEYGYQRAFGSYAVCIVPMITGVIMDRLILNGSTQTFSPCFYLFR